MTTLSLGQAARLTGRGKTILARAISGRLFAANKEDDGSNIDGAESARVYPFPAPVETMAELRTRLTMAEERLSELKAMTLGANRRRRACYRHLRHGCHCGRGGGRLDEEAPMMFTPAARQIMLELLAEVPIAASLGGIRPIPAQVDRR